MRNTGLIGLSVILGLLGQSGATAADPPKVELISQFPGQFWTTAQQLTQEQVNLVAKIQEAITTGDREQVLNVRARTFFYITSTERFLKNLYPVPRILCGSLAPTTPSEVVIRASVINQLGNSQTQAYCALYASLQQLTPFLTILERWGNSIPPSSPSSPPVTAQRPLAAPLSPSIRTAPQTSLPAAIAAPTPPAPLIGKPEKTPISGYVPAIPPAIAAPSVATDQLQIAMRSLNQLQATFPTGIAFANPNPPQRQIPDPTLTDLRQSPAYTPFLSQPNTGITQIRTADFYRSRPVNNRLLPTPAQQVPMAALTAAPPTANPAEFVPRLQLEVVNNQFQIPTTDLDYGFIVDLGNVPIENLNPTLSQKRLNLPPQLQTFFLNYRPPDLLESLQVDRRRFQTGKLQDLGLPDQAVTAQVPIVVDHTYVARLIEFQIPEPLARGERIDPGDRRSFYKLLEVPSSDVLVAFRPVRQNSDGSYTVIWRLLTAFPDPKIYNLADYLLPR